MSVGPSAPIATMGWKVDYTAAQGDFAGIGPQVQCAGLVGGTVFAFFDDDASRTLTGGFIAVVGIGASQELAECTFLATTEPSVSDYFVWVTNAEDDEVSPILPLPSVSVTAVECSPTPSTTTTTTTTSSSTTTTLGPPPDGCMDWDVRLALSSTAGPIVALQIVVDYGAAPGDFEGANAQVQCTSFLPVSVFAPQDTEASRTLRLGWITLTEFAAPLDLVTCRFLGNAPSPAHFPAVVEDAVDAMGSQVDVSVSVDVVAGGSCEAGCGDGVVGGSEQCDDGNQSNTDACLNTCIVATCGDGFVRAGFEQCDDGNQSNTDACLNTCVVATCGDGFVRTGVEQCDDGNQSNTDACLNTCVVATCGDGFVRAGSEQCDDGNLRDHDGCSPSCELGGICGDPTGDGRILAGDALRTLQRAVGLDVDCPDWTCDINGDGSVGAADALVILRASVGLEVDLVCREPSALVIRLANAVTVAGLQVDVDYAGAAATLPGSGASVQCQGLVPGAVFAFNDKPAEILSLSVLSLDGFAGPRAIARCTMEPDGYVQASDFVVTIVDARSVAGDFVPGVQVQAIPY